MKFRLSLIFNLLLITATAYSQRPIGTWKQYMSYQNASIVAETRNKVFAVYDGSLMAYTPEDHSIKTYSKADGLSDTGISLMAYSQEAEALVIIYGNNSNIDILSNNGFKNISSLKNNSSLQDKTINNVEIDGSLAYLSTAFGVVVLDLKKREIKDTYKLDFNTFSVCRLVGYIYANTSTGIYRGPESLILNDKRNWEKYIIRTAEEDKSIRKLQVYQDRIVYYFVGSDMGVYYKDSNGDNHLVEQGLYNQITTIREQLVLVSPYYISFFSGFNSHTAISGGSQGISSLNDATTYWLAKGSEGLTGIKKELNSNDFTITTSGIKIDSPKRNLAYQLSYSQNKLLVVGGAGDLNTNRNYTPGTLMVYENDSWFNFDETEISKQSGIDCLDFVSSIIDPRDPNHYFVGSWGEGLYEFKDNQLVQLYTIGNSSLEGAGNSKNLVRINGLAYDKDYNLFMTNSMVKDGLDSYSAGKEWVNYYYESLSSVENLRQILIDRRNRKWICIPRESSDAGIFVLDENNKANFSRSFTDQNGYNINATGYYCLAEDLNGIIWVGTDNGPITITPQQVAAGTCSRIIGGETGNQYRLLEGAKIMSIAVDGANRKWIGTEGDGVFCVDMRGEDLQVENFTTENSLLISDNVTSIAINELTGEVFIGTDAGLVSYMSDAISGKSDYSDVYAYPNPVRPAIHDQVVITGLMANSTVKITDLNGNLITQGASNGGSFVWNCTKRNGQKVTSGIYLVLASTPEGDKGVVTKIMVIK